MGEWMKEGKGSGIWLYFFLLEHIIICYMFPPASLPQLIYILYFFVVWFIMQPCLETLTEKCATVINKWLMTDSTILRSRGRARERKKKRSSKWAIEPEGEKEREGEKRARCVRCQITNYTFAGRLLTNYSEWVSEWREDAYTVINSGVGWQV